MSIASLLAAAALAAAPGAAVAQDAGGHQYDDPLADTPTSPPTPSPPSTPSSASTGSTGTSTASAGTTSSSPAATTAAATAGANGEIPRTGFPAGWITFAGFFALGGGLALRRAAGLETL
jgi:hypothetical protein